MENSAPRLGKTVVLVTCVEFAYWFARQNINAFVDGDLNAALWLNVNRIVSLLLCYAVFRRGLPSDQPVRQNKARYFVLAPAFVFLCIPVFAGSNELDSFAWKIFLGLTSFVVGAREELVYRGIIQNTVASRTNLPVALILSNVFFAAMHFGFRNFSPLNILNFFSAGMVMGLLYSLTRNLGFVIILHALYDAIFVFSPFIRTPLDFRYAVLLIILIACFLAITQAFVSKRQQILAKE